MHSEKKYGDFLHTFNLALPLIVANITVPLLGLVDTAILGHMQAPHYLAGAALGSFIYTQIIWICGFLKMSITGVSAQASNQPDANKLKIIFHGCLISLSLGLILILSNDSLLSAGIWLSAADLEMQQSISDYFGTRILSAPASLMNFVLVGWLIGQQFTKEVLLLQIFANLLNIFLSLVFVYVFQWGVEGVALGTVIADYALLGVTLYIVIKPLNVSEFRNSFSGFTSLLKLNHDLLLRNLALQFTLGFLTFQGAQLGEITAAINAILMQFFVLIALGLDGIANATEALVGESKGNNELNQLHHRVMCGLLWSTLFALIYSIGFYLFGEYIISLLTNQMPIRDAAGNYLYLMILLPLVGHWCFLFDGVFVGITDGVSMRNTMFASAAIGFFPVYWLFQHLDNVALWVSLLVFLFTRGFFLGGIYFYRLRFAPFKLMGAQGAIHH